MPLQALPKTPLTSSPAYPRILYEYNERFKAQGGRVNDGKFWQEVIAPAVPGFSKFSWYYFLRRFKSESLGLVAAESATKVANQEIYKGSEIELHKNLVSNDEATQKGIAAALNLGATFYNDLVKKYREQGYEALDPFERKVLADALHKAMKSQDSRIHALGKIRQDNREQVIFDRAFKNAAVD